MQSSLLSYRRLQLLLFCGLLLIVVVGTLAFSTGEWEGRTQTNLSQSQGPCGQCHDDFRAASLEIDFVAGQGLAHTFTARLENPTDHELLDPRAELTGLDNGSQGYLRESISGSVGPGNSVSHIVSVEADASFLGAWLDGDEGYSGLNDLDLTLDGPNGGQWSSTSSEADEAITLTAAELAAEGPGDYTLEVQWSSGEGNVDYTLDLEVLYTPPAQLKTGPDLDPGQSHAFVWRLNLTPAQAQQVGVVVSFTAHHSHNGEGVDSGAYNLTYRRGLAPAEGARHWSLGFGQAMGLGLLLLVAAALFSGLMTSSRLKWPPELAEAPLKLRGQGHTFAGLLLAGLALPHALTLQLGPYAGTSTGLLTGLPTLAVLMGLTYLTLDRNRLAESWGWPRWHKAHRATVGLFVGLLAYHLLRVSTHLPP